MQKTILSECIIFIEMMKINLLTFVLTDRIVRCMDVEINRFLMWANYFFKNEFVPFFIEHLSPKSFVKLTSLYQNYCSNNKTLVWAKD